MKFKVEPNKIDWWFWTITLVFIIIALTGWTSGYFIVIGISAFQIFYIGLREKSITAFETQVRILYFIFALTGLMETIQYTFYVILLLGTIMVVFFGKCSIAMVLRFMPWNKKNNMCSLENK
jgi:hypothetical protein